MAGGKVIPFCPRRRDAGRVTTEPTRTFSGPPAGTRRRRGRAKAQEWIDDANRIYELSGSPIRLSLISDMWADEGESA